MKIASVWKNIQRNYFGKRNEAPKSASVNEVNKAEKLFYSQYVCQGMIVFDIGANVGKLTIDFSYLVGDNGVVHAFEPSAETYERLEETIVLEKRKNVVLNRCALGYKTGVAKFHVYDADHSTLNSFALRPLKKYGIDAISSVEDVFVNTVDKYCQNHEIEHIDLLKIDVEGAELEVLRGADKMLNEKRVRCCIFEFGQTIFDMGATPQDVRSFLKEKGYQLRNLIEGDPVFPGGEDVTTAQYSMHIAEPADK